MATMATPKAIADMMVLVCSLTFGIVMFVVLSIRTVSLLVRERRREQFNEILKHSQSSAPSPIVVPDLYSKFTQLASRADIDPNERLVLPSGSLNNPSYMQIKLREQQPVRRVSEVLSNPPSEVDETADDVEESVLSTTTRTVLIGKPSPSFHAKRPRPLDLATIASPSPAVNRRALSESLQDISSVDVFAASDANQQPVLIQLEVAPRLRPLALKTPFKSELRLEHPMTARLQETVSPHVPNITGRATVDAAPCTVSIHVLSPALAAVADVTPAATSSPPPPPGPLQLSRAQTRQASLKSLAALAGRIDPKGEPGKVSAQVKSPLPLSLAVPTGRSGSDKSVSAAAAGSVQQQRKDVNRIAPARSIAPKKPPTYREVKIVQKQHTKGGLTRTKSFSHWSDVRHRGTLPSPMTGTSDLHRRNGLFTPINKKSLHRQLSDPLGKHDSEDLNALLKTTQFMQRHNLLSPVEVRRLLEIPGMKPGNEKISFIDRLVALILGTHKLFSFGSKSYQALDGPARVVLLFASFHVQLFLVVYSYGNQFMSIPNCDQEPCPIVVVGSWKDIIVGVVIAFITIPVPWVLTAFLSKQLPEPLYRHTIDTEESTKRKFKLPCSKYKLIGFLLSLATIAVMLFFSYRWLTLGVPVDHVVSGRWLVALVACVVVDLFAADFIRVLIHTVFQWWMFKPSQSLRTPKLKRRVAVHWISYVLLIGAAYGLFTLERGFYTVFGAFSQQLDIELAFVVFLLVGNSSMLLLCLFIFFIKPAKWGTPQSVKMWDEMRSLHTKEINSVAVLISCHLSADVIQQTLEKALHIFSPSQIFVCDNGRCTNPLDLWECVHEDCSCGIEGTRYFSSEVQVENHFEQHPTHLVRGYAQGKTAWLCEQVSINYNQSQYPFRVPLPGASQERINYVWIPEGSKVVALWYVAYHYTGWGSKFKYIFQMDDDVLFPSTFILPFSSFEGPQTCNTVAVALPLHAVNMKQENPAETRPFVAWQELEYRSAGYMKYVQSFFGSAFFCHGAASFWRRPAFCAVMKEHNTMHAGDDVQMGLVLHGLRNRLKIIDTDPDKPYRIDTCWHSSIGTQVPICWMHNSDWKLLLHRLLLGLSIGLIDSWLVRLFAHWKTKPCPCGEPSLLFQRALGWDTTEHRFVKHYTELFVRSLRPRNRRVNWLIAAICVSQLYIALTDVTRLWLLPISFIFNWEMVLIGLGVSWGVGVITMFAFNYVILKQRGHQPPPYRDILLFPIYKFVCVVFFRSVATLYNLFWYLPFNQNKEIIRKRMFPCNCADHDCASKRYQPPFFYYSERGHLPQGPHDNVNVWAECNLKQWHVIDRSISKHIKNKHLTEWSKKLVNIAGIKTKASRWLHRTQRNMTIKKLKEATRRGLITPSGELGKHAATSAMSLLFNSSLARHKGTTDTIKNLHAEFDSHVEYSASTDQVGSIPTPIAVPVTVSVSTPLPVPVEESAPAELDSVVVSI
eukprot:GILJ01003241.1.p1 GENE.GILJ01003241.1~~GILJ01003241.1.p1  ORF type:complete len:1499 (-),score=190.19 GILJ01003241.1:109-4518(-)